MIYPKGSTRKLLTRRTTIKALFGVAGSAAAASVVATPAGASPYDWRYPYPQICYDAGVYGYGYRPTTSWLDDRLATAWYRGSIKNIQRRLGLSQDGSFGPLTRAAVLRFQRSRGLIADGIVGRKTCLALGMRWVSGNP